MRAVIPALPLCLLLIFGMQYAFPQYDDTLCEILSNRHGSEMLFKMHSDRPVMGWILWRLDELGILWSGITVLNALGWAVLATFSCQVARIFFPEKPAVAVAAGLLTVAPVLVELQFVILNSFIWLIALGILALMLLLHRFRSASASYVAIGVAFALILAGSLVAEYLTALGLAGAVLLWLIAWQSTDADYQRQLRCGAVAIAVAGVIGYFGMALIKDHEMRASVHFSYVAREGLMRALKFPFRLGMALYAASGGALIRELGEFSVETYESILSALVGLCTAAFAIFWTKKLEESPRGESEPGAPRNWAFGILALVLAISMGLLPFLLMGRRPSDFDHDSRFFDPVLPYCSVLTAAIFLAFLPRRAMLVMLGVIAFIAGFTTLSKPLILHKEVGIFVSWGNEVRKHMAPEGTTVAIVPSGPRPRFHRYVDDELTGMLSHTWSKEDRLKFWALPDGSAMEPLLTSRMRGAKFESPVTRILLVQPYSRGDKLEIRYLTRP